MDECWLEETAARQRIGAAIFTPFVVACLQGDTQATEAILTVELRGVPQIAERWKMLRLRWQPESAPTQPLGVQEKVATEWAACGIACAVASFYTGLQVLSVADEGDRFDYWVGNGREAFGLEVSGTLLAERIGLEIRHRTKVRQLLENPYGVDGFVIVVGLTRREIIFSRQNFEEATL